VFGSAGHEPWLPRALHTSTLLGDGRVLVAGGNSGAEDLSSAEIFDPVSGAWSATDSMTLSRREARSILLPTGEALVVGGYDSATISHDSSETFDPSANGGVGAFQSPRPMTYGVYGHSLSLLGTTHVLLTGGEQNFSAGLAPQDQRFDVAAQAWTALPVGALRAYAASVATATGVVTFGGCQDDGFNCAVAAPSVLHYASDGAQSSLGPMPGPRAYLGAVRLSDQRAIVVGGTANGFTPSSEVHVFGLLAPGEACSTAVSCATNQCVDGVCCDDPCEGECEACVGVLTSLEDGVCGPVVEGTDPQDECLDDGAACVRTGLCGVGACAVHEPGACVLLPCAAEDECASGFCVDGLCCDDPCDESCESCLAASTGEVDGVCAPIPRATDPEAECPDGADGSCETQQLCSGVLQCVSAAALCDGFACTSLPRHPRPSFERERDAGARLDELRYVRRSDLASRFRRAGLVQRLVQRRSRAGHRQRGADQPGFHDAAGVKRSTQRPGELQRGEGAAPGPWWHRPGERPAEGPPDGRVQHGLQVRSHLRLVWATTLLLFGSFSRAAQGSDDSPLTSEAALRRDEAKREFEQGVELIEASKFEEATARFRRSVELFPTRSARENLAICLRELGRSDQAFEAYQMTLREHADLPEDVRDRITKQIAALDAKLGRLEIRTPEEGVLVAVDGRPKGRLPFAEPLRVVAGRNVIRLHLEGYAVVEQQVTTKPGQTTIVEPSFTLLGTVGRLRVRERSGARASVFIDGAPVGTTPWEGALAPGNHTIWLVDGGSEPGRVTGPELIRVFLGRRTEASPELKVAAGELEVLVTPPDATVSIDGASVGAGRFELGLPAGTHDLSVVAPGYEPYADVVTITPGRDVVRRVTLRAAVVQAPPAPHSPWELGLSVGVPLAPQVDVYDCQGCERDLGIGTYVAASAEYRFPFGLGVGLEVGHHRVFTGISRSAELFAPGRPPVEARIDDRLLLTGATILAGGSYRPALGDRFFLSVGSHLGLFVGATRVERELAGVDSGGEPFLAGPYRSSGELVAVAVKPEVRVGASVTPWLDLWVDLAASVLVPFAAPDFRYDAPVPVGADGAARFPTESPWGPHVNLLPGLGAGVRL
jgi:hypothetical protein